LEREDQFGAGSEYDFVGGNEPAVKEHIPVNNQGSGQLRKIGLPNSPQLVHDLGLR
jgi:hypothetical protein